MSGPSSFNLLGKNRFLPLFITQFLGAFNDNVFKNALMIMLVFAGSDALPWPSGLTANLAAGLFILPFFLFSATAGVLTDKLEKSRMIVVIKAFEVGIMLLGVWLWYIESYVGLLVVLFLMGAQSSFFGPVKYSSLPQLLRSSELVAGNALMEMGTFLAILLGTIVGGYIAGLTGVLMALAVVVIITAILGLLSSLFLPEIPALDETPFRFSPWQHNRSLFKICREQPPILLSILAISWFWLLGAAYLTQLLSFTTDILKGDSQVVTSLLVAFSVGVGIGSMLCERLSRRSVELGLIPIGAFGLSIAGMSLWSDAAVWQVASTVSLDEFLSMNMQTPVLLDLFLIGVFGGVYIVPLYAFLQKRALPDQRAQVIAANNVYNALFMVASSLIAVVALVVMEFSVPELWLILSYANLIVVAYICWKLPEFLLRFLAWCLSHTMYRVRHEGLGNIPETGAAVIVSNHVTYMDAVIMSGAIQRPIRFVMDDVIFKMPIVGKVFKLVGAIPICSRSKNPELYDRAFEEISAALQAGELVCIFPEGKLTRDGEIAEFKNGINKIIERDPVPVIPMALQGLWGSTFSHSGKGPFKLGKGRFWSKVNIVVGQSVHASVANSWSLETKVRQLRGKAQ